jgi:hypothetical protein
MPSIHWTGKHLAAPRPATLTTDSIIHPNGFGYPKARPSSRLILGDNLSVMAALLPEYEGRINLIYADPPFFTNRKFNARIGRGKTPANLTNGNLSKVIRTTGKASTSILIFSISVSR